MLIKSYLEKRINKLDGKLIEFNLTSDCFSFFLRVEKTKMK